MASLLLLALHTAVAMCSRRPTRFGFVCWHGVFVINFLWIAAIIIVHLVKLREIWWPWMCDRLHRQKLERGATWAKSFRNSRFDQSYRDQKVVMHLVVLILPVSCFQDTKENAFVSALNSVAEDATTSAVVV
jgi:hypothetical protein